MASFDGLGRMEALLERLGNPEKDFRVIHIAGTNGKGSTAVMTASILEEAGYSAGLYTSPHLETECERIQIWDGTHRMIDQAVLDGLREKVMDAGRALDDETGCGRLTVFEVYTAAAYLYFAEKKPDYVILETGLGGRLDSTNTIRKPLATVITQVGLDHTKELGSTIIKITHEKAGIIKDGVPVVSQTPYMVVRNIIEKTAKEHGSRFIDVTESLEDQSLRHLIPELPMTGEHQKRNAATALCAVRASGIEVPDDAITRGLEKAVLPGRFEILSSPGEAAEKAKPADKKEKKTPAYWIVDGAHNPDAVETLAAAFTAFARSHKIKRTMVIFGCMQDKNSVRMVQLLTEELKGCSYTATAVEYDRAEDPERLRELFTSHGRACKITHSVREAYDLARNSGFECILATGSIYIAGEVRNLFMHGIEQD